MGHRRTQILHPTPSQHPAQKESASEGLTLPELLISVAIVGLLSAISLPNYMNAIKATRQKDVANQISTIATSIGAYREEFLANPSSWDDLSRMNPVITNNGGAKGNTFTPITSPNGGYYTIAISSSGNLLSLMRSLRSLARSWRPWSVVLKAESEPSNSTSEPARAKGKTKPASPASGPPDQ